MSVDGGSPGPEAAAPTPVKTSDIPQAERVAMGDSWQRLEQRANHNPLGKTEEQLAADSQRRAEVGQRDLDNLQIVRNMEDAAAEKTAGIKAKIEAITKQEDPQDVVRQLGELLDQYHGEQTQRAIEALRETMDHIPAPLPREVAAIAIRTVGRYAGMEMNSDTQRDHWKIRENRREAGDVITTTALRSEDPELMEEAVNQLAKGLSLGELSTGASHTLVLERIATLADASADPRVQTAAIRHLDAYASLQPYPGRRDFHMGYLGSRAIPEVQRQARNVVNRLQNPPEGQAA